MSIKSVSFIIVLSLILTGNIFSQERDEQAETYFGIQPRNIIDAPTAWTLPRGCFDMTLRVIPDGGIIGSTNIGLSNRFMIGISYGAKDIISEEKADWYPRIEFNVKLRLIDEAYYLPAFSVGFISQGYGFYSDVNKRYDYKSKGFYGVMTRSLYFYNLTLGGHIGINYSMENEVDNDKAPSFFFGIDTQFNNDIAILAEYDMALNDDRDYGKGRGYLNLSVKWLYSENLELEAVFKNLLNNRRGINSFGRELRFTYVEYF